MNSYIDSDSDNRDSDRGMDIHCHTVDGSYSDSIDRNELTARIVIVVSL